MEKIVIKDFSVNAHIGVTEREQKKKQKLLVSIEIEPAISYNKIKDDINNTINYSTVRKDIKSLLKNGPVNLIETLAENIASLIKNNYNTKAVTVIVKKFPYRDTQYVACILKI